jgi:sulfite reductase (ferredoxin)
LKFVKKEALPGLYVSLDAIGFATPGFDSIGDVTTCPGTDTCNLGISNSMSLSVALEDVVYEEFPELIYDKDIKIKISGCMNSCGQHGLAHIGFHGSSVKANGKVVPAVQVLLGGGTVGNGEGRVAEKVLKVPSKRATTVLRYVLNDYRENAFDQESFHQYYDRNTKDYFYRLLKPLGDLTQLTDDEFVDWGHEETFETAIGVGECAGVVIDLVATLLLEGEEKLGWAKAAYEGKAWSDSIYHSYAVFVNTAKALLLDKGVNSSTQIGIIREFDTNFVDNGEVSLNSSFNELVLSINKNEPTEAFATSYLEAVSGFYSEMRAKRESQFQL